MADALAAIRGHVVWVACFSGATNLLFLAPSFYMLLVYDKVLNSRGEVTLFLLTAMFLLTCAMIAVIDDVRTRVLARAGLRLDRIVAPQLIAASYNIDPKKQETGSGDLLRRFDTFRQTISGSTAIAVVDFIFAPIFFLFGILLHPAVGIYVIFCAIVLCILAVFNDRAMRGKVTELTAAANSSYAAQEASGVAGDAVRAMGMRSNMINRQLGARGRVNTLQSGVTLWSLRYSAIVKATRVAMQSGALGLGAWLAIHNQISPGSIIAVSILASRAFSPIEQIVGAWKQLREANDTYKVINETLSRGAPADRTALPTPRGSLKVENVSVAGPEGARPILSGVSFEIRPGEVLGLIGPSGAGKTTLVRICAGSAVGDDGAVRIDGANLLDWDPDALGRHVGFLPQGISLMAGTIADNIRRFEPRTEASAPEQDQAVVAAARAAGAHEMILGLPKGYDTPLSIGGRGLSLGQSQRVGLARALFRNPPILILDEPNAHLDTEGEAALVGAILEAKKRNAAVLFVSHRSPFLRVADTLMVLTAGKIVAHGPRDQIAERMAQNQASASQAAGAAPQQTKAITTLRKGDAQ